MKTNYRFARNVEGKICVVEHDEADYALVYYHDGERWVLEDFWQLLVKTVPVEDWPRRDELCFLGH